MASVVGQRISTARIGENRYFISSQVCVPQSFPLVKVEKTWVRLGRVGLVNASLSEVRLGQVRLCKPLIASPLRVGLLTVSESLAFAFVPSPCPS